MILAVCIIGVGFVGKTLDPEESQQLHRLMKQSDIHKDKVHSVVNFDLIKQRYQD